MKKINKIGNNREKSEGNAKKKKQRKRVMLGHALYER